MSLILSPDMPVVEKDDGDTAAAEHPDEVRIHFRRHDGHAIDLALEHAPDTHFHTLGAIVGVGNEHFVAVLHGNALETFHQFREERVLNVGDDHAVDVALAGAKSAGMRVGVIAGARDGGANAFFQSVRRPALCH